jgi:uncharacterized protein YbcI
MAVSREMVRLFKEQFGRGPTRARTYWAGADTLVCLLEDTLTPAERNLVEMGEQQRLRDTRLFFQYANVAEFCGPVERITGRKVKMFFSAVDTEADGAAIETFVLYPPGEDGPSRGELRG